MSKPEFSKPFNIEHAKAGAPILCADGCVPEILKYGTKLFGTITNDEGDEFAASWSLWGVKISGVLGSEKNLVMAPLGMIDGKPVFVGDAIEGLDISGDSWIELTAKPKDRVKGRYFRWPAPAKVYPETRMSIDELEAAFNSVSTEGSVSRGCRAIASAALRHAVDNGYLVTPEEANENALEHLQRGAASREARDIEVAKAALEHCGRLFTGNGGPTNERIQAAILEDILAKVQ